ncbi:hypothetical protein THAOC_10925 [Thalassiosira oceanica]|uniref:Uncharacterized protein n=1 Tax=Thalassiosira oceanica TaxID=159749 RepID=K0TBT5_THAOC|nr:hypothetical protein THAOC_10925 [Thalassiosira oceanica]|eukprot:EJK67957.1 hypothetical protein THAOC_10925 [Thalassiosira oceanica]
MSQLTDLRVTHDLGKTVRERARQAKKQEDPDVRDIQNVQQRVFQVKKREDPDLCDKENAFLSIYLLQFLSPHSLLRLTLRLRLEAQDLEYQYHES